MNYGANPKETPDEELVQHTFRRELYNVTNYSELLTFGTCRFQKF